MSTQTSQTTTTQASPQSRPVGTGETLLMEGTSQVSLRLLSILAITFAVGSLLLSAMLMSNDIGLGNNVSSSQRAIWAGGLLLVLGGFLAASYMYRRRIASRITLLSDGEYIRIESPSVFGRTRTDVSLQDVVRSRYHEGDKAGEEAGNMPWLHVQVRHNRSFVVPLTGNIPNKERLLKVLNATR